MSDRELLEKQAAELGIEVPEGVSDADLKVLLAAKMDRKDLEDRAEALGVEEIEGTSGDELQALVDAAQARADLEAQAKELGVEFAPNIGDKKLAQRVAAADKSANSRDLAITQAELGNGVAQSINGRTLSDREAGFTVHCAIAGGRRRAGRRWPGGATPVAEGDLTEEMLAQLKADPLFHVTDTPAE